jgi:TRAP-type uncharacterized transport system fused permease subunit
MDQGVLAAVEVIFTSLLGIFGIALGTEGFIYRKIPAPLRLVAVVGGLTLLYPGLPSDLLGLVLVGGVVLYQRAAARRAVPDAA